MTQYEMTENLARKCNVTLEEAKVALEAGDWNMLMAGQLLEEEKLRKMQELDEVASACAATAAQEAPEEAAAEASIADEATAEEPAEACEQAGDAECAKARKRDRGSGLRNLWEHVRKLVARGNRNRFEIRKGDALVLEMPVTVLEMPVTVLVLALVCMFWLCLPLLVIGLFAGCRYSFSGVDMGRESINGALGKASAAAEQVKKAVTQA